MKSNVKMILDEVNARIKLAEAKTAEDPSNFDSFPGAENDKKVPAEEKKPDPEVKDEGPASRTEVTGAEPGSDAPVEQEHLYEADEPVLTPEKKPADTAEADAKEASANPEVAKVASDILGIIKGNLNKKAEAAKTEKKDVKKEAENHNMSLKDSILDKIASVRMAKQAGANDAMNLIKAAAEYQRGAEDAQALIYKLAQAMEEQAADVAPEAEGAADAEAAMADAASQGGDEDPVTPEEVAQAVGELVQEGQISQEDAASVINQLGADEGGAGEAEGDVSDDDIAEGIAQAIDSGEITEDEAQQLVQELVGAGADPSVEDQVADQAPAEEAAPEAEGAADAEAAIADAANEQKTAEARFQKVAGIVANHARQSAANRMQKSAEDEQMVRYQRGFIQKCAEYGCDPQKVAQYIKARLAGAR